MVQDEYGDSDVEEIAAELTGLAGQIAAQTCRFLGLLGQFDAREAWSQYAGILSCAHWLSWQCGMSASTAREHVRVARALNGLPATKAEFTAGRLSYSKVRAITRVATPQTEPELVDIARAGTAEQLERFCAAVRTTATLADVNVRHARRRLTYRTDEDGSLVLHARCSPEEGAVILEAVRATQEDLEGNEEHGLLDALVQLCAEHTAAAPARAPAKDSARSTRRSETILHVTLADLAAATSPAAQAPGDSGALTGDSAGAGSGPSRLVGPHLEGGPALHPETARRLTCDTAVITHLHQSASAESSVEVRPTGRPGRTIDLGRRRRTPNVALRRALWHRDDGCVFPGCDRRRFLHAHHLRHWADGGPTNLDNMVLLCGQHHRLLHEGGYQISRRSTGELHVYGPGGAEVVTVPRLGAVAAVPDSDYLQLVHPSGEVETIDTGTPAATGAEPLRLEYAVSAVLGVWEHRASAA